eukprot:CAMPEP_0197580886 /NCGR_PEP_ID=MMETSP1326-20131121/4573_1 /TAXON_ID=1155430 /ORGANISM="Genus nov. species nov., Strain RCC2288" /LENGTH=423 /DNA_ID=CAMNT_0043144713 /DNA_START=96 /DNA_END=1367 /DNA_ORIENTATION=+
MCVDGPTPSLLICDKCEKVRCVDVGGEVPSGRWTCCTQPSTSTQPNPLNPQHQLKGKGKGKEEEEAPTAGEDGAKGSCDGGAPRAFACESCLRTRLLPDGLSEASVSRCCDLPDAQVIAVCGGARVASQLLQAGIATQQGLAALGIDEDDDTSELCRVASVARVNVDALVEWVQQARERELDEVMHDLLAPPPHRLWDVKLVFARLEERAGVSTPADLANAPVERTLFPALEGLDLTLRDVVLMTQKAAARIADAPPWMAVAKSYFPAISNPGGGEINDGEAGGEEGGVEGDAGDGAADAVDAQLLRVALQTMREHPDITQAGEAVRYLYRLTCNIVDQPEEVRYRRLRVDNRAYVAHVLGVRGASLGMEALGWRESPDGSICVLPDAVRISHSSAEIILECMKGLIALAGIQMVAASNASGS